MYYTLTLDGPYSSVQGRRHSNILFPVHLCRQNPKGSISGPEDDEYFLERVMLFPEGARKRVHSWLSEIPSQCRFQL
jgi:hypothetical protein